MRYVLFLSLIITFVFTSSLEAISLRVDKTRIRVKIKPGEVYTGTINVDNPQSSPITVKAYLQDFLYVEPFHGEKKFFPAGSTSTSCSSIFQFTPKEFIIPAFARRKINFTVKMPLESQGGYYGVLFIETTAGKVKQAQTIVNVSAKIGVLLLLESANSKRVFEIKNIYPTSSLLIKGEVYNRGDVVLKIDAPYYVLNSQGVVKLRGNIKTIYLPPQQQAYFKIPISPTLPSDTYTLVLTFEEEGGEIKVKEINFKKYDNHLEIISIKD